MDFVLGEIEHVLHLVVPRNPNVDLVKGSSNTYCAVVCCSHDKRVIAVTMRDLLLEHRKATKPRETSMPQHNERFVVRT